ncbi:hypothetical protein [Pararhizobium sp. IMCC21322]|uniref:hypothetical protein n=1 Tax=Pararhizobium sp. IMCC21322 TaxID=3067903 RepID=UPI0027406275|nr:hypothetical protein [Pararhizobium sp. IMCC21322]
MIRPVYFVWVIVPIALYLAYQIYGTPYLNWSYDFYSDGGNDPFAERHYTRCTYTNFRTEITIHPGDGNCPRIKFFNYEDGEN